MTKDCDLGSCCCICCGATGNRADCTCRCNKCSCARSRLKIQLSGGVRKKKTSTIPPATMIKFTYDSNISIQDKLSKKRETQWAPKKTAGKNPYNAPPYPKEVAEQSFEFCYNEQLAEEALQERLPVTKVPRSLPSDENKGIASFVVVVKFYIIFLQGVLYLQFAKSVTDKVIHVHENMWCMPSYNPENAALSVCMFLLLLHIPIF
jgi:hypothetical protein